MNTLLLVPTAMERDRLLAAIKKSGGPSGGLPETTNVELCGFGVAAAAAMTMRHLLVHQPDRVILAGIAGALAPNSGTPSVCQIGAAYWFSEVICDGIGVGEMTSFRSAGVLGWPHVQPEDGTDPIGDHIRLCVPGVGRDRQDELCLVTGCAGAADDAMAKSRLVRTRATLRTENEASCAVVAAEDMEGFAVALACRVAGVPVSILRGISNRAGDRDHANWQIAPAMDAVAKKLAEQWV
ncbi:futalosine hydrolase [Aporhodopirellula aestuarii]|uniref:Futalosine hydrolase n=1 Tax=Aporhodopirellula aestuarii TaxID=2950107 RepID=A0ABT0U0G9_9BACT|nr:futalosine hydrolase [Aporhodopirellula aestuarii]MCM2370357.1 futalosine hydrolase [Aporhodopirellula aestuarii]